MPEIILETYIRAPIDLCFDLFRDIDLHKQTSSKSREKAIAGKTSGLIELGEEVTFEAIHFGVKQRLTSKVIEFERPYLFVDVMTKGTFKYMRHQRTFEESEAGTIVRDNFNYVSPFWIFGRLFDYFILERYMRNFLIGRNKEIKMIAELGKGR